MAQADVSTCSQMRCIEGILKRHARTEKAGRIYSSANTPLAKASRVLVVKPPKGLTEEEIREWYELRDQSFKPVGDIAPDHAHSLMRFPLPLRRRSAFVFFPPLISTCRTNTRETKLH
jgi:hypothetical protein